MIFRDITESRLAEEALQQAQAELAHLSRVTTMGELVASIAHEVNQPLAAIVTNGNAGLRWLAQRPPNLTEVQNTLTRIVQDGSRAGEVIGRIRVLLKKNVPQMVSLDVNELIRGVLLLVDGELRRSGVVVRTDLVPGIPSVLADRVQLQQVILNLVMNGIDAMTKVADRRRELRIESRADADIVRIQVQDSGIGLSAEQFDRIFQPFFSTKANGLGMGLPISRSIIEAHGGSLRVCPSYPYGAAFQFTLPRADLAA
jgi:C4-dicarboxylate-specific signal transduction histidine kinase